MRATPRTVQPAFTLVTRKASMEDAMFFVHLRWRPLQRGQIRICASLPICVRRRLSRCVFPAVFVGSFLVLEKQAVLLLVPDRGGHRVPTGVPPPPRGDRARHAQEERVPPGSPWTRTRR